LQATRCPLLIEPCINYAPAGLTHCNAKYEHLGFDLSFLVAGASTVALFSINTEWVFRSRKLALRSLAVFTLLYAFIYVLLRVEAYALIVGSIASFAAVTAAMYITRNVDWYGNGVPEGSFATSSSARESSAKDSWLK
jgi:inner membrane protein involved in colicin E2 resistance